MHWWYLSGMVRGLESQVHYLLHMKSKTANMVKLFIFNLDFSYPTSRRNILLKYNPHTPLKKRMIETLGDDILPNKYTQCSNSMKSYLTKKQTSIPTLLRMKSGTDSNPLFQGKTSLLLAVHLKPYTTSRN